MLIICLDSKEVTSSMELKEKFFKFHEITVVDKNQFDSFIDDLNVLLEDGFFFTIRVNAYNRNHNLTQHLSTERSNDDDGSSSTSIKVEIT